MPKIRRKEYAVAVAKRTSDLRNLHNQVFKVLKNGFDFWVADPFPIEKNGRLYIFGEIFEYRKNRGSIGYTKLEKNRSAKWKVVIREDYHLSFPNIFEVNGILYMCPEANESGQIYLYRCIEFPQTWTKEKIIYAGERKFCDTIFFRQESEIYGLTYELINKENKLRLFKVKDSDVIFSKEMPNILKEDFIRPGGKIFSYEGKNILPAQIGTPTYGSGIILKKININWPTYTETELARLYATDFQFDKQKKYIGMHTLNFTDNYVVVDVIWYHFNLVEFVYRILRKMFGICKIFQTKGKRHRSEKK